MDLNALIGSLLSGDSIQNMSSVTGTSQKDVQNVLSSALPSLLNGAENQANNEQTAEGFVSALANHAKADTSNLGAFLSNVDLEDGGKIIGHLLGNNAESTTQKAAEKAGISAGQTGQILSMAAPLLMSLLGQQTGSANSNAGIASLMGNLMGGADISGIVGNLLGGNQNDNELQEIQNTANNAANQGNAGGIFSALSNLFGKKK